MPKSKPAKRRRFTPEEKHALVIRYRTRPRTETNRDFTKKHGISPGLLHKWTTDKRFASDDPVGDAKAASNTQLGVRVGHPKGSKNKPKGNTRMVNGDSELEVLQFLVAVAFSKGFLGMKKLGRRA